MSAPARSTRPDLVRSLHAEAAAHPAAGEPDPPAGDLNASVMWLLHRHPLLARLVVRIAAAVVLDPGTHHRDPRDGTTVPGVLVECHVLATAVADHDTHVQAWHDYAQTHPAPRSDSAYELWAAAGPRPTPGGHALACMSSTERTRLRLLALFATSTRTRLAAGDLVGLDAAGHALLLDVCRALLDY
ncbi:MAG: hypothetical protein ACFCVG_12930 [Kineosporiaceae bacterium]